jgi:adenylyltransferase/sulfurtransferase
MSIQVKIPTPLRRYAGQRAAVPLEGETVGELLDALFAECPDLEPHLRGADGEIRNFVNIFVNGEDVRHQAGTETKLSAGDQVAIVPAIAGGAELSNPEIYRYSRHLILPEVTIDGQRKLKNGSVLMIGAGGLGSPAALYLAAAGVGRLGIVDFDVVDETNLQRQILHDTAWLGKSKLESAKAHLAALNPYVEVETYETALTRDNALELFEKYDVILDGTDNFETRYLTNDACYLLKKPNVYGSIFRFEGQASVFWPDRGPCYRCLYPEPPPPGLVASCAEGGVLGVLPGVVGGIQATEALKILMGIGEPLVGRLLLYDAMGMTFQELKLRRDPKCPMCSDVATITELQDYQAFCGIGVRGAEESPVEQPADVTAVELKQRLDAKESLEVIDVREPFEERICRIDGARLVPLGALPGRLDELDRDSTYILQCRSGKRSAEAVDILTRAGFKDVHNLRGGILAWARDVDPSMPVY